MAALPEALVDRGRRDTQLFDGAHGVERQREAADFDPLLVPHADAERILDVARRFVAAIAEMIGTWHGTPG